MSDKEKALTEQIGKLPPELQNDFLKMAIGAAMAVERQGCKQEEDHGKKEE